MNPHQDIPPLSDITASDFDSAVLRSVLPVLVAFRAPWSRPCHILDSTLDEVATACALRAKVVRVNADDYPDLSLWYEVQSIPTLLYFVGGEVRAKIVGTASKEAIIARMRAVDLGADAQAHEAAPDAKDEHDAL